MATLENRDLWEKIAELIKTISQGGGGGGGSGNTRLIPVTDESGTLTSDFDYDDIIALLGEGCYCVAVLNGEYLPLGAVDTTNSEIDFINTFADPGGVITDRINFTTSGVTYSTITYPTT